MHIIEETKLGYDIECNCGKHIFAFRTDGVVECIKCGRARDPGRLCEKWSQDRVAELIPAL